MNCCRGRALFLIARQLTRSYCAVKQHSPAHRSATVPRLLNPYQRADAACPFRQEFISTNFRSESFSGVRCLKTGHIGERETNEHIIQERDTDDRSEICINGPTVAGSASRTGSWRISALAPLHTGLRSSGGELHGWRSVEPDQGLNRRDRVPPKQRPASPRKRTTGWMDRIRGRWRTSCRATHRPVMKTSRSSKSDALPLPVIPDEVSLSTLRSHTGLLSRAWRWMQARQVARSSTRRLRVAETVSLGEKRFVAVVQVDGRHFLLAGGPTNIVLLAQLDAKENFGEVLKKTLTTPGTQVAKRRRTANAVTRAQVNLTNSRKDAPKTAANERPRQRASKRSSRLDAFPRG